MALTEAQAKAQKTYAQKNKDKKRYWADKSAAKRFVSIYAGGNELKEIKEMIKAREELLENIKWFNNTITEEIMKIDGTKDIKMITGFDLLTDDEIEAPATIEKDKVYIMDNQPEEDDFYEVGTRQINNFIKDYPQISADHKNEILERFGN